MISGCRVADPTEAFEKAVEWVVEEGTWVGEKKEVAPYVCGIVNPSDEVDDWIIEELDDFHGEDHFEITSQWTFPEQVDTGLTGEPRPNDSSGEYFERLCTSPTNQIESMRSKIEQWGRNNRTVAQVFQVERDLNAMFPPCLLTVQVLYRDGDINIVGHYRSHTICKSYLGDIVSLYRLQRYLANNVNVSPSPGVGEMTIFSSSLHTRKKNNEHEFTERIYDRLQ